MALMLKVCVCSASDETIVYELGAAALPELRNAPADRFGFAAAVLRRRRRAFTASQPM